MDTKSFFYPYGDQIDFKDKVDLLNKISNIDDSVPPRTQGRKSHHRERYSVVRYLKQLAINDLFEYPFSIYKDESPDFFLILNDGRKIGLEHRDVATKKYQAAMTALEKAPDGSVLETAFFDADDGAFTQADIKPAIRKPGEDLISEGADGDIWERHWAQLVFDAFKDKTILINEPHFKPADSYELILEDVTHISMLHDGTALKYLKELSKQKQHEISKCNQHFNRVHVIKSDKIFFNVLNSPQIFFLR